MHHKTFRDGCNSQRQVLRYPMKKLSPKGIKNYIACCNAINYVPFVNNHSSHPPRYFSQCIPPAESWRCPTDTRIRRHPSVDLPVPGRVQVLARTSITTITITITKVSMPSFPRVCLVVFRHSLTHSFSLSLTITNDDTKYTKNLLLPHSDYRTHRSIRLV